MDTDEFHIDSEFKSFCNEASEEDLCALAELHEDPTNDAQIELYIYLCFLHFQKSKDIKHLEQAIQWAEGWAAVTPAHHPDYNRRYSLLHTVAIGDHQFQAIKEAIEAMALRESERPALDEIRIQVDYLNQKVSNLHEKFKQHGRLEDLEEAIETRELAISISGSLATPLMSLSLAILLNYRFDLTASMDDLNRAINIARNAADAVPRDDPQQGEFLGSLGTFLGERFEQTGSMDDINQSISMISKAVDATPYDHPNRFIHLSSLGSQLSRRFDRTGLMDDLNEAARVMGDAVDAAPYNSQDRAACLSNLGGILSHRFKHIGSMDDLDRAVIVQTNALDGMPSRHPRRTVCLSNLGASLATRFGETKSMADLNQAVIVMSDAVDALPYNHPFQWSQLHNLSALLSLRFEQNGSRDDLNRAVSAANDALHKMPRDHPGRATCLSNLGTQLCRRFEQTGLMDDLNQAISVASDAVDATPHNHPNRLLHLYNLGNKFGLRFEQSNSEDDMNQQLSSYIAGWNCTNGSPSLRLRSAHKAADILVVNQRWEKAYQLLHDAISLLPIMSPRSLNHTDTQTILSNMFSIASLAAAVALQAGKPPGDALRLLELGRGVTASLLMDMRGDVTELQLKHPDLAVKFRLLREDLDTPTPGASLIIPDKLSSWELQINRRREADEEFNKTIDEIRAQPGFSHFLQPPAIEELMNAASQGPIIVVNISYLRSDAFLIQSDSIRVMELLGIVQEEVGEQITRLKDKLDLAPLLEWLWHAICRPCLDALGFTDPISDGNWPHVWWIPTNVISQMPLHAAGIYKHSSKETVMDRVVSSYASSIKALLHGRKRSIQKSSQAASPDSSALIVAMQDTPGLGQDAHLQFAEAEMKMLQDLCPKLQLCPSMPRRRKDDILEQLAKCKLFHFAGHGRSDPENPSQSCLLLEDWETNPLTMGAVRDSRLQDKSPFLAYLSACSTGANKAVVLADEGVHLISAFQLAGFRHVVGTLWEVSDKHCVDVARILYRTLQEEGMTDVAVSRGLHRAVRALRDGVAEEDTEERDAKLARPKPEAPRAMNFLWVPYIHFGV